jgi:hypothetical protein
MNYRKNQMPLWLSGTPVESRAIAHKIINSEGIACRRIFDNIAFRPNFIAEQTL